MKCPRAISRSFLPPMTMTTEHENTIPYCVGFPLDVSLLIFEQTVRMLPQNARLKIVLLSKEVHRLYVAWLSLSIDGKWCD